MVFKKIYPRMGMVFKKSSLRMGMPFEKNANILEVGYNLTYEGKYKTS